MYTDPNMGGLISQALVAIAGVGMLILYTFSGKIRQFIARLRRSTRKDEGEEQE